MCGHNSLREFTYELWHMHLDLAQQLEGLLDGTPFVIHIMDDAQEKD